MRYLKLPESSLAYNAKLTKEIITSTSTSGPITAAPSELMPKTDTATAMAISKLFEALVDQTRVRLLSLMNGKEVSVWYFAEILGQNQPKISRHLALPA